MRLPLLAPPLLPLLLLACDGGTPDKDVTTPADDSGPTPTGSDDSAPANAPPSAPVVAITPASPGDGDALTATIVEPALDPEGEEVTYRYAWTRDGADAGTDLEIGPELTAPGETWGLSVVASDGVGESAAGTAEVVIGANQPPVAPAIHLEPAEPQPGDTLELVIDTPATDPDGDALTQSITWSIDGTVNPGWNDRTTFEGVYVEAGEVYVVTVTVSDGVNEAVSVTDTVTIPNTAPEILALSIAPTRPVDGDDLLVRYGVNDPDGDTLTSTVTWLRDGVDAGLGNVTTVPASETAEGESWEVELSTTDGHATTTERSAAVLIEGGSSAYYINSLTGVLTDDGNGTWTSFSGTWSLTITTAGPLYGEMDCANSWAVLADADPSVCPSCDWAFSGDITTNGLTVSSGPICDLFDVSGTAWFYQESRGGASEFGFHSVGPTLTLPIYYYYYGGTYAYPPYWYAESNLLDYDPGYTVRSDIVVEDTGGATNFYAFYEITISY